MVTVTLPWGSRCNRAIITHFYASNSKSTGLKLIKIQILLLHAIFFKNYNNHTIFTCEKHVRQWLLRMIILKSSFSNKSVLIVMRNVQSPTFMQFRHQPIYCDKWLCKTSIFNDKTNAFQDRRNLLMVCRFMMMMKGCNLRRLTLKLIFQTKKLCFTLLMGWHLFF